MHWINRVQTGNDQNFGVRPPLRRRIWWPGMGVNSAAPSLTKHPYGWTRKWSSRVENGKWSQLVATAPELPTRFHLLLYVSKLARHHSLHNKIVVKCCQNITWYHSRIADIVFHANTCGLARRSNRRQKRLQKLRGNGIKLQSFLCGFYDIFFVSVILPPWPIWCLYGFYCAMCTVQYLSSLRSLCWGGGMSVRRTSHLKMHIIQKFWAVNHFWMSAEPTADHKQDAVSACRSSVNIDESFRAPLAQLS